MTSELTEAPASACRFAGGRLEFAASDKADATKPRQYKALARSAETVDHWLWGRCVHDFAGMRQIKDRLTLDYEHYEPVGYLDDIEASNNGLNVAGAIVPTTHPEDRGRHIIELSDGGVPYEASIYFGDDVVVEYVPEGAVAPVNGRQFEGPGIIFREWTLRAVAVCPYGQDPHTESAFTRADDNRTFKVSQLIGAPMAVDTKKTAKKLSAAVADPPASATDQAKPTAPASNEAHTEEAADGEAEPTADPATPAAASPAAATPSSDANPTALSTVQTEMKRYRTAFGAKGLDYFADGLSFEAATAKHVAELSAQLAAANQKLSAGGGKAKGETTPVGSNVAGETKRGGFSSAIRIMGAARN